MLQTNIINSGKGLQSKLGIRRVAKQLGQIKMDKQMLDAAKHIEIMDFLEDLVTQHDGDITYMAVKVYPAHAFALGLSDITPQ